MQKALTLYQTTIGKKAIMAISGIVLVGFVIGHLAGNLQLYLGPEAINSYAAFLKSKPGLLWGARFVLLAAVGAHIMTAVQLARRNVDARPPAMAYKGRKDLATNYAARTMYWSGPILLLYIVYHLAHLTLGYTPGHEFSETNVYNNVVYGFMNPWVSVIYIAGNAALGFHLYHGVWSMLQTLGIAHPRYDATKQNLARALGVLIAVGNISFPVAVMAGAVEPADSYGDSAGMIDTEAFDAAAPSIDGM